MGNGNTIKVMQTVTIKGSDLKFSPYLASPCMCEGQACKIRVATNWH